MKIGLEVVFLVEKLLEIIIIKIIIINNLYYKFYNKDFNIFFIMYCKDFLTTYKSIQDDDLSQSLYQSQLLQAFNMDIFNESDLSNKINIIEKELYQNLYINDIKEKLIEKYETLFLTKENIFVILFCYDYFDEFHKSYVKNDFSNFKI
jgi:hypothetical protein